MPNTDGDDVMRFHRPPSMRGLLFSAVLAGACLTFGLGVVVWGALRAIGLLP